MVGPPSYGLITPARDESDNLPRLAAALAAQTVLPAAWVIVDNGSTDDTAEVAAEIAREHPWVTVLTMEVEETPTRAGPTVQAFQRGLAALGPLPDIVVKLDADVSFSPDYFAQLLGAFEADPSLGMASGTCYEQESGSWRQRHVTEGHVWGASRAYRRRCLEDVLPLESGLAWDGIDELKAAVKGWRTTTLATLPFYHHRAEAARESSRWRAWVATGAMSHYMGYRFGYLVLRTLHHTRRDPVALGSIWGYLASAIRREPRYPDPEVRAYLRRKQSIRNLPMRIAEAFGRGA
jgi:poly-beta-1,6-N-acetyl-D-glucosamine synthase